MKMRKDPRQTPYLLKKKAEAWAEQVQHNRHLRAMVEVADPHHLVNLMYQALLNHLANSQRALQRQDAAGRTRWLTKAIMCVNELRANLRFDLYPELAKNLNYLYDYTARQLAWGLVQPVTTQTSQVLIERMIEIQDMMKPLAAAWLDLTEAARAFRERTMVAAKDATD